MYSAFYRAWLSSAAPYTPCIYTSANTNFQYKQQN